VKQAFIAAEDHRFYDHWGIDPWGLGRALWANFQARSIVQGGSTLTQQLAKNFLQCKKIYTYQDRSLRRKIQELLLSFWLEYKFTKDQILTLYLNRVYFGGGNFGISAAAQRYFHRPVQFLTVAQGAILAGLVKAPTTYCPLRSPHRSLERGKVILKKMETEKFLTPLVYRLAHAQMTPRIFTFIGPQLELPPAMGYFSDWILESLSRLIGPTEEDLVVVTTLDWAMQKIAQKGVDEAFKKLKESPPPQVALISMTPQGAVRALIGGRDYGKSQFNRATQALRQPGSAFKLCVYLAALEAGYTPQDVVEDGPLKIGKWHPKNYNWTSQGEISLTEAFARSVNTAAVRLTQKVGVKAVQDVARRLGILQPLPSDLSLSLGTGEMTLLDLTTAYATVKNDGQGVWPYGIERVFKREGKVLLYQQEKPPPTAVVDPLYISFIKEMLYEVLSQGTGRKMPPLSREWGGKTGTTQDHHDALFVGYSDSHVCSVWVGYDDNRSMGRMTGAQLPLQICQYVLKSF
jgi:penicillin-binding protein 1A